MKRYLAQGRRARQVGQWLLCVVVVAACVTPAAACRQDTGRVATAHERACHADFQVENWGGATISCMYAAREALLEADEFCKPDSDYAQLVYADLLLHVAWAHRQIGETDAADRFLLKARVTAELVAKTSHDAEARKNAKSFLNDLNVPPL